MTPTPRFGKTALELLEPNTDYDPTFLEQYYPYVLGPCTGVGMSAFANLGMKRPFLSSGILRHVGFSALAILGFQLYKTYKENYNAERDAVYRHYIQLHPEDFPPPERRQYKDVFESWLPIR